MRRHHGNLILECPCRWLQGPIASASPHIAREHDGDVDIVDRQASGVVERVLIDPVRVPVFDARNPRPPLDDSCQRDTLNLGYTGIEVLDSEAPELPSSSACSNSSSNSGDSVPDGHLGMVAVGPSVVCGI